MSETAKIIIGENTYELPVITGSENEKAIDIRKLRQDTSHITLDSGYANTGACTSAITFIDGEKGVLEYVGIDIDGVTGGFNFQHCWSSGWIAGQAIAKALVDVVEHAEHR